MDKFFNHEVADWISKSMRRMDPDEAEMFGLFLVDEVYWTDRENNARLINRHVEDIHKSILNDVSDPVAKRLVETVSKAGRDLIDPDIPYDKKWGKPQPRDKGGKFVRIRMPGFSLQYEKNEKGERVGDPRALYQHAVRGPGGVVRTAQFDLSSALDTTQREGTAFQQRWNKNTSSSTERTYNRIATGGNLVRTIGAASGNGNLYAAGRVGEFVGEFGPEAEKVIGPAARKTAYRYRGTERTPSSQIDNLHDEMLARRLRGEGLTTKDITPELRMDSAELAAIFYLGDQLPSKQLSELQLKSGKVPPSQGVMIDRNGDIVAEAVGYNEDHYLPFNLKNLKNLKGGSYVRTRSTGGLTTEDIYTGLLAGARSVTVVSRSGVFTLDFDDELRGGRRYSDKAHQMVGRYGYLLDAVKSEQVVREKLSPEERAEIRANVEDEMKGGDYTTREIEDEIADREKDFISGVRYSESEVAEINRKAEEIADEYGVGIRTGSATQMRSNPKASGSNHRGVPQGPAFRDMPKDRDARVRAIKSELMDALREKKSKRKYVLDGEGYEAAMLALKEQYPYFIADVHYRPFREVNGQVRQPTNERDSGYVMPRYNRPAAAMSGYFAEEIEGKEKGKGKIPANQTKNQNYRVREQVGNMTAVPISDEEAEEKTGKGSARHARSLQLRQAEARVRQQELESATMDKAGRAAKGLFMRSQESQAKWARLFKWNPDKDSADSLTPKEREELKRQLKEMQDVFAGLPEEKRAGMQEDIDQLTRAVEALEEIEDQMLSDKMFDLKTWDPRRTPRVVPKVEDKEEYVEGGKPEAYQKAWERLNRGDDSVKKFARDVDPNELRKNQEQQGRLAAAAADLLEADTNENREAFQDAMIRAGHRAGINRVFEDLDNLTEDDEEPGKELKKVADKARKEAERIMRLRRIKQVAGDALTDDSAAQEAKIAAGGSAVDNAMASDDVPRSAGTFKKKDARTIYLRVQQDIAGHDKHSIEIGHGIADALENGDDQAALNQLDELKEYNTSLYNALRRALAMARPDLRSVLGFGEPQ